MWSVDPGSPLEPFEGVCEAHTVFIKLIRYYLPFSLSFSVGYTVVFQRLCDMVTSSL